MAAEAAEQEPSHDKAQPHHRHRGRPRRPLRNRSGGGWQHRHRRSLLSGNLLLNEIAHKATYSFTTNLYGLDGGQFYVDAQLVVCKSWTVTFTSQG